VKACQVSSLFGITGIYVIGLSRKRLEQITGVTSTIKSQLGSQSRELRNKT